MSKKIPSISIYVILYALTIGLVYLSFVLPFETSSIYWLKNIIIFLSFFFMAKYFIYMMAAPIYDTKLAIHKLKYKDVIQKYRPKVSVLIPAWNESVGLISTVKSVLASSYDNLEVVVINDGSTDESDALMQEYLRTAPDAHKVVYHYQENGGKGKALNTGIGLSTGQIIMSIDADCVVEVRAVDNFVAHFADPRVMAAVGNVKIGSIDTFVGMTQYLEFMFSFYFKKADSVLGSIYIIGGAAGAFRKEVFDTLGGYSESNITEDIDLTVRIQDAGMKIVYAADAVVYTEGAFDIKGLKKQRLRWKRGRIDTFIKYRSMFFSLKKKHNTFLAWFAMPFAVFGDIELLFEIPFVTFILLLAFFTHDFSPFIGTMLVGGFIFCIQAFNPRTEKNKKVAYILAPIGWLVFMVITYIEITALVNSLRALITGRKVEWQRWQRKGIS